MLFKMTQIGLIAGIYQPQKCGVAHYTSYLRKSLLQRGVQSYVFTTHEAAKANSQSDEENIFGVVNDWGLTSLLSLVQAIHKSSIDLLHIQHAAGTYAFERSIFLLPLLLRLTGWRSPIITTVHEYGWWEWQPEWIPSELLEWLKTSGQQKGWWDREDGFLLTHSDGLITTNHSAKQVICDRLPQLQANIYEIPIGANIPVAAIARSDARHQLCQACQWPLEAKIIAFFGFLHPVKGVENLLQAFQQVLSHHPQARLLLIGGVESLALPGEQASQYWQKLQTEMASLGLSNTLHMTGYVDEATASQYLTGADVGVLPFHHGVTLKSGSLLALMAHHLPVIATQATPPDPELSDRLAQLIPTRDIPALTAALDQLLTDATLRDRLSSAGKNFSQQFSWDSIADAHLEIYEQVLTKTVSLSGATP